ncbi:phospholipase D family protein [Pulveribacter suum]|uniref:phospholipase D family protein n=1 Tax=Pulveribacter suum TaxID=2116657 RepID=UPI001D059334|nr:phospholipase D family protein [Pulveribacter suum]
MSRLDPLRALSRRAPPLLAALLLGACSLPPLAGRSESSALDLPAAQDTRLGRALAPAVAAHPGLSGIHLLQHPHDAFAARALLARAAERTLDVQYYIWRGDTTGTLLLGELLAAAERGVRVRLLLDDVGTSGLDTQLAALDAHPRIEVRLFNPFTLRRPKALGYLADLRRANRRMHNKSFTADNQASIVGGRNVGDEYFGATAGVLFADLDVLAVGPVAHDVSADFDRYWASASTYPAQAILPAVAPATMAELAQQAGALLASPGAHEYAQSIRRSAYIDQLLRRELPLHWAHVRMLSDDPAKGLGQAQRDDLLLPQLEAALGQPGRGVDLVSPYFVPTAAGAAALARLQRAGVRVRVLTNAFEATDVPAVHAGYARYRRPLLQSGVTLYEMRRLVPEQEQQPGRPALQRLGSSGSSLHAKTFAVDGERLFVGSLNFDPRSARLNTELGFLIDSPALARQLTQAFDTAVPAQSYQVALSEDGSLQWRSGVGEPPPVYGSEPHTTWWSRAVVRVLMWLPIEWLL